MDLWIPAEVDTTGIVVCLGRNEYCDKFEVSKVEFRPIGCFRADGIS